MIFLGGVHGTGKTSLCSKVHKRTGIPYFTASELIRDFKKNRLTQSKLTRNIDDNQHILIKSVEQIPKKEFILDGHLCLLNENQQICKINRDIIKQLNPSIILVKTSMPNVIRERLIEQDGQSYDVDLITRFQDTELNYAQEMARFLDIPIVEITDSSSLEQVYEVIRRN